MFNRMLWMMKSYEDDLIPAEEDKFEAVDSVVEFRRSTHVAEPNQSIQMNKAQGQMIHPDDLEGYIQKIVDNRWRQKEVDLLKKHIIPVANEGENSNTNRQVVHTKNARTSNNQMERECIKSPSDSTIYAPALIKTANREQAMFNPMLQMYEQCVNVNPAVVTTSPVHSNDQADHGNFNNHLNGTVLNNQIDEQISNFIEGVRLDQTWWDRDEAGLNGYEDCRQKTAQVTPKDAAANIILNAEQFKANIVPPKSKPVNALQDETMLNRYFLGVKEANVSSGEVIDDDQFFHITCHIDNVMVQKIERGEFVDLEKLLVKVRPKRKEFDSLEFVTREGQAFLSPVSDHEPKINGVRRWEQAFRTYAAIYSKAQPHRAPEIWQYVHVINSAPSNYIWENVVYYDYTFRQMMSKNPKRSWAKIFNQLWNLAMVNPIQRTVNSQYNSSNNVTSGKIAHNSQNQVRNGKGRRPCWQFNKNVPCNHATCGFEHRCSYCGSHTHSVLDCYKTSWKKEGHLKQGGNCKQQQ